MAGKAKRNAALRHLAREIVRENFLMTEVFEAVADAMEEEAKRVEVNPQAKDEVSALEHQALSLRELARAKRTEFG